MGIVKLGSNSVDALKLGSNLVNRAYLGDELIYPDFEKDLWAYFKLDDTTTGATNMIDSGPNAMHGANNVGGITVNQTGIIDQAYVSTGANECTFPASATVNNVSVFTVCCWIKTADDSNWAGLYGRSDDFNLYVRNGNVITTWFSGQTDSAAITYDDDQWHHIAVTKAGNGVNDMTFYFDGVVVGTGTETDDANGGGGAVFGSTFGGEEYTGLIDDVRDYDNRVLTVDEINALPGF